MGDVSDERDHYPVSALRSGLEKYDRKNRKRRNCVHSMVFETHQIV